MRSGAVKKRGLALTAPCGPDVRRRLDSFGAGVFSPPAPLPTRSFFPPFQGRVGFQYFHSYIASVSKLLPENPFRFSRVWLSLVHSVLSFVAILHSLVGCKQHSNDRSQARDKDSQERGFFSQEEKGAENA